MRRLTNLLQLSFRFLVNVVSFLFHAGGYLVLAGGAAAILALLVLTSMPGKSYNGVLAPASPALKEMAGRMREQVTTVASVERNVAHFENLEASARYLEAQLTGMGYRVARQEFMTEGRRVRNLVVTIPAVVNPGRRLVIVGAHYDSAPGTNGANDNGTGVAALLELARAFRQQKTAGADLELVLYVNEEPPYFRTPLMGSAVHARALKERHAEVVAMLALETLGAYSEAEGSQHFPHIPLLSYFFPSTGNFVAFIGNVASYPLVRQAVGSFRHATAFPAEGMAAPSNVTGTDWSDHLNYAKAGIPSLMVTDTAPYRFAAYHTAEDRVDKVDFDKLARVTEGLVRVVVDLVH